MSSTQPKNKTVLQKFIEDIFDITDIDPTDLDTRVGTLLKSIPFNSTSDLDGIEYCLDEMEKKPASIKYSTVNHMTKVTKLNWHSSHKHIYPKKVSKWLNYELARADEDDEYEINLDDIRKNIERVTYDTKGIYKLMEEDEDIMSLWKRLQTPKSLHYKNNYETLETVGDSILDFRLFEILVSLFKHIEPGALHSQKKYTLSKEYLAASYNSLPTRNIQPSAEIVRNSTYREDTVEASYYFIYKMLSTIYCCETVFSIIDKLILKSMPYNFIPNSNVSVKNIKNVINKYVLSDTTITYKSSSKLVSLPKTFNSFVEFLNREDGQKRKLKSSDYNIVLSTDRGILLTEKGHLSDKGYTQLLNILMKKYNFDIGAIYKYYGTRFIPNTHIYSDLLRIHNSNFMLIETIGTTNSTKIIFKKNMGLMEEAPEKVYDIDISLAKTKVEEFLENNQIKSSYLSYIKNSYIKFTKEVNYINVRKVIISYLLIKNKENLPFTKTYTKGTRPNRTKPKNVTKASPIKRKTNRSFEYAVELDPDDIMGNVIDSDDEVF